MSIIQDFMDSIGNALTDMLKSAVENSLTTSMDMLSGGLSTDSGEGGIISTYLYTSPNLWLAGAEKVANHVAVWQKLKPVFDDVLVPIGSGIFCIVMMMEFVSMINESNSFKQMDMSVFIRWILKLFTGILIISNLSTIVWGIFALGTSITQSVGGGENGILSQIKLTGGKITINGDGYGFGDYFVLLLMSGILLISIMILLCTIVVVLASRMIEVFMYVGVAPITASTFFSRDFKEVGMNWIRGVLAIAFQGLFIVLAIGIFGILLSNTIKTISEGDNAYLQMATTLGYSVAMIFTVLRTGSISKSMFNAH